RIERVRTRKLEDGECRRGFAVEVTVDVIVLSAELDPLVDDLAVRIAMCFSDDILHMDHSAFGRGLNHDVLELAFARQPACRIDRQLELDRLALGNGRLTKPAGRDLSILFANGIDYVGGRKIAGRQFIRVKPDAHAVIARAEKRDVADTLDAGQIVFHAE